MYEDFALIDSRRDLDEAAHDETELIYILLDAEVENEDEIDDPGEVRQTHHVASLNSFPERAPGVVRQPHHVSSHSSFRGPEYLKLHSVRMASFSASEAVVQALRNSR